MTRVQPCYRLHMTTPQRARMLKCSCPECGYTVRTTRKWLDVAVPRCPVHNVDMTVEGSK